MNNNAKKQLMQKVLGLVGEPEDFKPFAYYNKDGDCIEFFAKSDDYYAERVDGLLTVYRSRENGEIIGSLLKNIKEIINKYPGFSVEIHENKVHLAHLLLAGLWSKKPPKNVVIVNRIYQSLIESVKKVCPVTDLVLN